VSSIQSLLDNNREWSREIRESDPGFFPALAEQQSPEYLWIGCSDSRVSANTIVGLKPGEVFVHRNVANLVNHSDMNCLSVLQFAVEGLKVKHVIVCGHYGCGGVQASMDKLRHGLIDNWLRHIKDTANLHSRHLEAIADPSERCDRLCELNVAEQVLNVGETTIVQDAWDRGQPLEIHGWIYGLKDGIIRDLDISIDSEQGLEHLRRAYLSTGERVEALSASDNAE
jgi:carbonic anhydrase